MHKWFAAAASGIEGIVGDELRRLGFAPRVGAGRCFFEGSPADAFRASMWLRAADRLHLHMGSFIAADFSALFDQTHGLPWKDILPGNAAVHVHGSCVRSQLMSLPDCQRIVKRAIATRMTGSREGVMPETGPTFDVDVHIHSDEAVISIDASGPLHKRGYRTGHHEAPLRETLAAALLLSSPWRPGEPLWDPMCGSGTLPIEAALIACNLAPNLARTFSIENWPMSREFSSDELRQDALESAIFPASGCIWGSDIDPAAIETARLHARAAGVHRSIEWQVQAAEGAAHPVGKGWMVTNPPYGMRLGDDRESRQAAKALSALRIPGWGLCALTPDPAFERVIGRKAHKHRRFYNGRIECRALIFMPEGVSFS